MSTNDLAPLSLTDSLTRARLPRQAPAIAAAVSVAAAVILGPLLLGSNWWAVVFLAAAFLLIGLTAWTGAIEGRRSARDRAFTLLVYYAIAAALVPLVWVLSYTVAKGLPAIDWSFITHDQTTQLDPTTFKLLPGAGVLHAIIGTLLITAGASVISIPIGLMAAVYLVEYAKGSMLARATTILVDVMSGIPSIVAGLFALGLFTTFGGAGIRFGLMGSVALSLLMIPTVVRSAEEMLRLVPVDLREASLALGVPVWRTILKVVVPTAMGGIITGIMLAIARVIGETAPLLVAVGTSLYLNNNLFSGPMQTLPVYIMDQYSEGPNPLKLAWGAALVLIILVMIVNLTGRLLGRIFAPKTGR